MPEYTDIPIVEGPTNQQTGEYSFVLPTRFNDDESNVTVVFPSSVSKVDALAEVRESFPRNSADTQVQKMTDPEWYTKINKDDYFQLKADEHKYPGQDVGLGTIAYHAAKDALAGIGYLGKELGTAAVQAVVPGVGDQRMAARHAWNVVEGFMQGNERLSMLAGLLEMKIGDVAMSPLRDSESNTDADFQRFIYTQEMGKTMAARTQGQMIAEGGGQSPVFGDANFKPQFVPSATEADVAAANSIGNVLDVLAVTPVGGALEKAGAAAGGTMFKYVMPTALADTAIKAGFTGARIAGTALDEASKMAFNQITRLTEAVGEGAVTDAGKAVANYTAKAAMYGGLFTGPGGTLIGASLAGKALRSVGEVGGAVMAGLEEGGVRASLQALSENELKASTVRWAAKKALAIAPPDIAFNAMKGIVDSMATTGATMGTLNAMSAWASNDDPVKAFAEGMASGAGFGLSFGAMHAPFGMTGQDKVRLANMFDNDIRGRELTKSFSVTQPSGHTETVSFNDLQGRIDLFNREDLSARQKAMILAMTQGHERGGGTSIFVDGSPESAALMEKIGFGGTKGVHYFDGADGKSTIIIDPKYIDPATAAEEVMHSLFTENIRKEVVQGVQAGLKSENPVQAVDEISKFGMRYAAEMEAAGHPERAAEMRDNITQALDPAVPMETKLKMLDGVINEYTSNYVGAAVHGMKPDIFLEGNIRNIWDKVWDKTVSNVLSTFDFTKNGLTKDPIKGHFFDEKGKRVIMPEMEGLVGRFVDAVREGRGEIASKDTVDGAHYVDVRTSKPYSSPEDFVDGRPTTLKQKKEILKSIYEQNIAAASAIDPSLIVIADPATVESGMLGGNVAGLKNKQVLFSRGLPDSFFTHLSAQESAGKRVYTSEQIEALKGLNEAMKAGHIVMSDAWHDIRRTKGDRSEVYYGRTNRPALPVSWQQTETGGLLLNQIDVGRVWNQMRYFAKYEPKLRAELASKDIRTFSDVIPYIQRYFDNYSSGSPKPAAKLKGFSEVLRDGISRALDIKNRKAFAAEDAARFANEHTFDSEGFPSQPQPKVTVNGIEREVNRDRVSMQAIRSDRILGLNDFTVDGFNVPIKYDPGLAMNLIRANFAPGSTTREKMPNGEVLTDKVTGNRIIVSKTGKASLYEGDRRSIYGSVDEAIAAADKRSVAATKQRASFSPSSRDDMPEGPVYTREQALQRINSAPDWDLASMLKDEQGNAKRIERTYNRFLMQDPSQKRVKALDDAIETISSSVGVNIDKSKFPFFTEKGEVPYFYKERGQLIGNAYPELADLFALGDMEAQIESKKMMGMSWDALRWNEAPGEIAAKHGQKMSDLTDKIYNQFKGSFSKSEILNKALEVHDAISNVYSKTSDDIGTNKLKNEFISLRDATRSSFAPRKKSAEEYSKFVESFPQTSKMSSIERDVALRNWMRENSQATSFNLRGLGKKNLLDLEEAIRKAKPSTVNQTVKSSEEFRAKVKAHDSLMAKIRSAYKNAGEFPAQTEAAQNIPYYSSGSGETYKQFRDRAFAKEKDDLMKESSKDREEMLDIMASKDAWSSAIEQRALSGERIPDAVLDSYRKEMGAANFDRTFRGQAEQKGYVPSDVIARSNKEAADFRAAKAEIRGGRKIADTMESLAHKPEASNQSIALAVDKAYQAGEIPLETLHATKAKLAEAVDEDYVAKRYEAMDTAKGAEPAMTQEEINKQIEGELRAAGMRVPNWGPTEDEISAVDAKRHDTEVILRDKELKQNRGLTEKQKAMYAERADKQMVRMDEQTNRMLNNARAEALAQGKQAMQRTEQERIVSRRESFIEAFKTQAEAKAEAKKYLEEEASAERKKLAAQRESDTAARQESKKKQAQSIEERKQGFKEALTERDTAKAEAKKYFAEERAAERARIAQEKEAADKLAAENKAKRNAALEDRRLGFEELLKEKAKSEREYQRDLKKNLDRSEKAQKFHAEERAARAAENAKLAEKEALRVKLRTIENEKHVRAMEELLKAHDTASLGETTAKGTEVVDAKIPHNIRIIITPARRFRVYMPTGSLVGVSDTYKEALKTAQRNAPKKVSVR